MICEFEVKSIRVACVESLGPEHDVRKERRREDQYLQRLLFDATALLIHFFTGSTSLSTVSLCLSLRIFAILSTLSHPAPETFYSVPELVVVRLFFDFQK